MEKDRVKHTVALYDAEKETTVRFKMFKKGRRWLVAGMTTVAIGAGVTMGQTHAVKADETTPDPQVDTSGDQTLTTEDSHTLQTSSAEDTAETTTPVVTEQPTPTANLAPSTSSVGAQAPVSAASTPASDAVTTPSSVAASTASSVTTDATATPEKPSVPSSTASAAEMTATSSAAGSDQAAAQPAQAEAPTVPDSQSPADEIDADTPLVKVPAPAPTLFAAVTPPSTAALDAGTVSAVNPNNINITAALQAAKEPRVDNGNATVNTGTGFAIEMEVMPVGGSGPDASNGAWYYSPGKQAQTAAETAALDAAYNQAPFALGAQVFATNTRTIDGQLVLTSKSVVTVQIPDGNMPIPASLSYDQWYPQRLYVYGSREAATNVWIAPITDKSATGDKTAAKNTQMQPDGTPYVLAGTPITDINSMTFNMVPEIDNINNVNIWGLRITLHTRLNLPDGLQDKQVEITTSIANGPAEAATLKPHITRWDGTSTIMTGTGTAVGDTITIRTQDGSKSTATTVGAGGNWSLDLASAKFTTTDSIVVIESNDLGTDYPGVAVAPQYANAERKLHYINAVTGVELGTGDSTPMQFSSDGTQTVSYTQAASSYQEVGGNTVAQLVFVKTPAGTNVAVTRGAMTNVVVGGGNTFAALPTTSFPSYNGVVVQRAPVPGIAAKIGETVDQDVYYFPDTITVDPNQPADDLNNLIVPPKKEGDPEVPGNAYSPQYPAGLTADNLVQTVTRTITYINALDHDDPMAPPKTETLRFTRTATVDFSTAIRTFKYNDWIPDTTATFDAVATPQRTGWYTPQMESPQVTVDAEDPDINDVVYYFPAVLVADPDNPTDDLPNGDITPKDPGTEVIPGHEDSPKYPDGITQTDLESLVTRTIQYVNAQTNATVAPDNTETLRFTRKGTVNFAKLDANGNAQVTYTTPWQPSTTDTFAAVDSPTVEGMFPHLVTVDPETVDENSKDIVRIVKYYPNSIEVTPDKPIDPGTELVPGDPDTPKYPGGVQQGDLNEAVTRTINYVDAKDPSKPVAQPAIDTLDFGRVATVHFDQLDADGNPTVTYADWTPKTTDTFDAVTHPTVPGFVTLTKETPEKTVAATDDDIELNVKYYPATVIVEPDKPIDPGVDVVPGDPDSPKIPEGVQASDLNDEVLRTIKYVDATDTNKELAPTVTQPLAFTRVATIHYDQLDADGKPTITYSAWLPTSDVFPQVLNPQIPGYVTLSPAVLAASAIAGDEDLQVIVKYYPATIEVTPDKPIDPGVDVVPGDPDSPKIPDGVTAEDLNDSVIRTIRYVDAKDPNKEVADTATQTLTFTRVGTIHYDQLDADGKPTVTYSEWTPATATFEALNNPHVDGYITLTPAVLAQAAKALDADVPVVVKYYPATIEVTPDKPVDPGVDVVPGDPDSPKYPQGVQTQNLNETVRQTITYVDARDTTKTVAEPNIATLDFGRVATIHYDQLDENGDPTITYAAWTPKTTATFVAVTNPAVAGMITQTPASAPQTVDGSVLAVTQQIKYYPATIEVTPDKPVDPGVDTVPGDKESPKFPEGVQTEDLNQTVTRTIHYVDARDPSQNVAPDSVVTLEFTRVATIHYDQLDADGKPTVTYTPWTPTTSDTFDAVPYPVVAGMIALASATPAQTVGATDADIDITVRLYPATIEVTPDKPVDPGVDTVPGDKESPKYPEGVQVDDLNQSVTQTIRYQNYDGNGDLLPAKTVTLNFTRTATIHYDQLDANGNPTVTYSPWTPTTTDTFATANAPTIPGYTALYPQIAAHTVNATDVDFTDTFYYVKNATTPTPNPGGTDTGQPGGGNPGGGSTGGGNTSGGNNAGNNTGNNTGGNTGGSTGAYGDLGSWDTGTTSGDGGVNASLPAMSDKQATTLGWLGAGVATAMGLFGLAGRKRRKQHAHH